MNAPSVKRDALVLLLARAGALGLSVVALLALALLVVDTSAFGRVSLVFVLAWGLSMVLDLGISTAHTYWVAHEAANAKSALLFTGWYTAGAALLCAAAFAVAPVREALGLAAGGLPARFLAYGLVGTPLVLFLRMQGGVLLGMRRSPAYAGIELCRWGLLLLLLVGASRVVEITADLACRLWIVSLLATSVYAAVAGLRGLDRASAWRPDYPARSLAYGLRTCFAFIGFFLIQRSDYLFLAHFRDEEVVGIYEIATRWAELLLLLPGAIGLALFPSTAQLEPEEANRRTAEASRLTVLYALLALPLLSGALLPVIALLRSAGRPAFGASFGPFLLLLPGVFALAVDAILSSHFQGRRLPHLNSYVTAVMLVCNLALNLLLIPRYGAHGAATATSIAYVTGAAVTLALFVRHGRVRWRDVLICRPGDLAHFGRAVGEVFGLRGGRSVPRSNGG